MGGLVVDVSDMHDTLSKVVLGPVGVIHLANLRLLPKIELSDKDIRDKSKADSIAKTIVFLQICWLILQCTSRAIAGYPLTLLEVHTVAHAGCAIIMYSFWPSKPLNVNEPTLVSIESFKDELALMIMRSPGHIDEPHRVVKYPSYYKRTWMSEKPYRRWHARITTEVSYLAFNMYSVDEQQERNALHFRKCENVEHNRLGSVIKWISEDEYLSFRNSATNTEANEQINTTLLVDHNFPVNPAANSDQEHKFSVENPPGVNQIGSLCSGEFLDCGIGVSMFTTGKPKNSYLRKLYSANSYKDEMQPITNIIENLELRKLKDQMPCYDPNPDMTENQRHPMTVTLSEKDLLRWSRASSAFRREYHGESQKSAVHSSFISMQYLRSPVGKYMYFIENRALNLRFADILLLWHAIGVEDRRMASASAAIPMGSTLLLLGMMYGGIHLALWDYPFASNLEKIMWRVSSVELIAVPFATVMLFALAFGGLLLSDALKGRRVRKKDVSESNRPLRTEDHDSERYSRLERAMVSVLGLIHRHVLFGLYMFIIWSFIVVEHTIFFIFIIIVLAIFLGVVVFILIYFPARIYIIVESFISLRHVPIGVYKASTWANYIPHL
jgi:hypothetical protein